MAHFLLKTEPSVYSLQNLKQAKRTAWDGIANPVALKHLRSAALGDDAVVYHTGDERAAVGLAKIVKPAYIDEKSGLMVDVKFVEQFARSVTLGVIKADPLFADSPLVRQGRLSFVPLTDEQFKRIMELAKA